MTSMFRSATFKLTAAYLVIVMAISVFFSFALYHVATGELARGLHRESQRIYSRYPVFEGDPILQTTPDYATASNHIFWQLAGFNVLVLISAGFASYGLARRTLKPIEAAHLQQQRFTADVSHELRTPLTALRMEAEVALLNAKASAKDFRETIQSNLEEVTKLEALINNLLRLSQLEVGELQQGFEPINVASLVDNAVAEVTNVAKVRGVRLITESKSAQVWGDAASLQQLLVILLDNAIKYSPPGALVTIRNTNNKQTATLQVIDQGSGISQSNLEHIFDRFYRADSSRGKSQATGYGLGLSIAKLIADQHQAFIEISSRPNDGTTASLRLPLLAVKTTDKA